MQIVFVNGVQACLGLGLPLLLVAYDLRVRGRPHVATVWGLAGYFAAIGGGLIMATTGLGQALVAGLE